MSWKPMDTAPKDGTVIILYADFGPEKLIAPDVFHAFYDKSEGHWDSLAEDVAFHTPCIRELATLLGWIEVPNSSPLARSVARRDGKPAREPGKLHIHSL